MQPGEIEYEFGVPIPGLILPEANWARTGVKRLPEPGPLDWTSFFGREVPVVLDLGCGNGRFTLGSALARPDYNHCAVDELPMVIRYATCRANQRGLHNVRFVVKDARIFVASHIAEALSPRSTSTIPNPITTPARLIAGSSRRDSWPTSTVLFCPRVSW